MDFYEVVRTLSASAIPTCSVPITCPEHADPGGRQQAFAFAYGYIKAMVQAVNGEGA